MSRSLRREEHDAHAGFNNSYSNSSGLGTSVFGKNRRFYEEVPLEWACSTAPCYWCGALLLWCVIVASVALSWNLDFFRPALFLSPVLFTLVLTFSSFLCGIPGELSFRKLLLCSIFAFLLYWTVYKAYPSQCRSAWGFKMVSDAGFIRNQTAINMQMLKHMHKIYVTSEADAPDETFVPLLQTMGQAVRQKLGQTMAGAPLDSSEGEGSGVSTEGKPSNSTEPKQAGTSSTSAKPRQAEPASGAALMLPEESRGPAPTEEEAEEIVEVLKDQLPSLDLKKAENEWLTPWTSGDTFENFLLRAYCDMHRKDQELPHVYPLLKLGIGPMEVPWKVSCPYGSCILTEPRDFGAGKLSFLWFLVMPAALNLLHARVSGQCYEWWQWLWAFVLPLWLVAFIESIQDVELSELIAGAVRTIVELPKLFRGDMGETDYERVGYLVLIVSGIGLMYYFRDRIREELGLHEWLPFLFAGRRSNGFHTFQVCVWKVDGRTHAEQDEEDERPPDDGMLQRGMRALGVPVFPSAGLGVFQRRGYTALFGRGGAALPDSISVRMCYGGEELQRTRAQQSGCCGPWPDVYLFQENFTLSLERRPGTVFTVEIQGKSGPGIDFSSSVNFTADRLDRAFQRSSEATTKPGYVMDQRIADTQVVRMRNSRVHENVMTNLGFHHYPGSSGGEIWLAFCDMDDDADSGWLR